jgi:tubby-related protein 1
VEALLAQRLSESEADADEDAPSATWVAPTPPPTPQSTSWRSPELSTAVLSEAQLRPAARSALVRAPGPAGGANGHVQRSAAGSLTHFSLLLEGLNAEHAAASPIGASLLLSAVRSRGALGTSSQFSIRVDQPSAGGAQRGAAPATATLSSNLLGTEYLGVDCETGCETVAVAYALNVLGSRGPRRVSVALADARCGGRLPPGALMRAAREPEAAPPPGVVLLRSRLPLWHPMLQAYTLSFGGRVSLASVKNMQLDEMVGVGGRRPGWAGLQFGKVGKDVFSCDWAAPMSAMQAFMVSLSSLDGKCACE